MPLLKGGHAVADAWVHLDDAEPLPPDGVAVTVSGERWERERAVLLARAAPVGVRLGNGAPVEPLAADLPRLGLIALHFPKFSDGRAYSQARRLRRAGYRGELRATGNVLQDQLLLMARVGFDAFQMAASDAERRWQAAVGAYAHFYQPRRTVA
ncbi:oxidoreductase [Allostella sp. ATCC 35155]|nr:oxidoreductase [Stella sp. ATCC 35155]